MHEVDFVPRKRFDRYGVEHLFDVVNPDFVLRRKDVINVGVVVVKHLSALGARKARVVICAIYACRHESEKLIDDFVVGGYHHIGVAETRREVVVYEIVRARTAQRLFKGDIAHFIAPLSLSTAIIFCEVTFLSKSGFIRTKRGSEPAISAL